MRLLLFVYLAIIFSIPVQFALAAGSDENRFTRVATPVDPVTLRAEGMRITLWGIKPVAQTSIDLKALDLMDNMIGSAAVTCRPVSGTSSDMMARCSGPSRS